MKKHVMMVLTRCKPGTDEEFNDWYDRIHIPDLLSIPDDIHVVAGVTIGRPRPDPNASRATSRFTQRRRGLEEVVHWERW